MAVRLEQFLKLTLALWLGVSVLSAAMLTHLPELHAELHHHHAHSQDHGDHDHHPDDQTGHTCLVQFFAENSVEAVSPPAEFIRGRVGFNPCRLVGSQAAKHRDIRLHPPGRAPPIV